ncbi:serine-rich adhesin for platelets-like [Octopus sinensis]|uniref:Serine-rich adhesin for platelets-like n=1 Tax=Octopus sinensis TaxID=2607531 RepID=A0A6P7T1I5_9MOLL|nr:serine-rich adhesin for platelets-like [Octopus sinensis]
MDHSSASTTNNKQTSAASDISFSMTTINQRSSSNSLSTNVNARAESTTHLSNTSDTTKSAGITDVISGTVTARSSPISESSFSSNNGSSTASPLFTSTNNENSSYFTQDQNTEETTVSNSSEVSTETVTMFSTDFQSVSNEQTDYDVSTSAQIGKTGMTKDFTQGTGSGNAAPSCKRGLNSPCLDPDFAGRL